MVGKKGAELAISTIVVIVVSIVVLVVLIVGFTSGWGNLWGNISAFFGGSNVDSMVQACNVACTTQGQNAYCNELRSVTGLEDKKTCKQLAEDPATKAKGFKECLNINCPA
jgi:hypothetical protein